MSNVGFFPPNRLISTIAFNLLWSYLAQLLMISFVCLHSPTFFLNGIFLWKSHIFPKNPTMNLPYLPFRTRRLCRWVVRWCGCVHPSATNFLRADAEAWTAMMGFQQPTAIPSVYAIFCNQLIWRRYPIVYKALYIPGGAKFHPSTVGGGNSNIFYFLPEYWGRFPFWRAYFSNGLKPPTSIFCLDWSIKINKFMYIKYIYHTWILWFFVSHGIVISSYIIYHPCLIHCWGVFTW